MNTLCPPLARGRGAFPAGIRFLAGLLLLLTLVTGGCASSSARAPGPRRPLYAITAPTAEELAAFETIALTTSPRIVSLRHNGVEFRRTEIAGRDCLLFVSGMSMVNAAMTAQLAADRFPVTHLLALGAAGGVNPTRDRGDVVVAARWHYHSEATYLNPQPSGDGWILPPGFTPKLPNFGMIFPESVSATQLGASAPEPMAAFPADPGLVAAATKVATDRSEEILATRWPRIVVGGSGVSGPVFVDNREYRAWLYRVWQAEVVDMESTALAQVCWANRIPFVAVRVVGDLAGSGPLAPSKPVLPAAAKTLYAMLQLMPP